ncbi:glycosyltransferase [Candidatus Parcubacteria bacterium]|nr:MAG: glycosyltransferase [Candidatus Parcubacteria bacterium]
MRLLITTQAVDQDDPVLGFFVHWITEIAQHVEAVEVICLKEGLHTLPMNVRVHSLGKEERRSRITYVFRFFRYMYRLRRDYDAVFVHMNSEYVVLGGLWWRLWNKRIYLWRNHWSGGLKTMIAIWFSTNVFCTSKHSYTAQFKKTKIMPIGVDIAAFGATGDVARTPHSILFLARLDESKRPDLFVEALERLHERGVAFTASIVGNPTDPSSAYAHALRNRAATLSLEGVLTLKPGVSYREVPKVFAAHDIFVNLSRSGMYDKTLVEAAAAGCLVLASSDDYAAEVDQRLVFADGDLDDLTKKLEALLSLPETDRAALRTLLDAFARKHSLPEMANRLAEELV